MNIDFAKLADAIKDKIGRKQIIAITTIVCLTYLAASKIIDLKALVPVLIAGTIGIIAQSVLDYRYPRQNGNGNNNNGIAKP